MYENLVLNPGLISMPPEEFNEYVAQITQAQAHAEEYARKPIEVPRDLPDLKGMRNRRSREKERGLHTLTNPSSTRIFHLGRYECEERG